MKKPIRTGRLYTIYGALVCICLGVGLTPAYAVDVIDVTQDWQQRSSGAIYAENFNYPDKSALIAAAAQINGNITEYLSLETEHTLSGQGVRIDVPASAGANTGSWNNFINGVDATVYKRFYLQFVVYADYDWLNYPFKQSNGSPTSPKLIIIDQWNSSFNAGEIVITNQNTRGFVTAYRGRSSDFPPLTREVPGSSTFCPNGDPDYLYQFPLDTGVPATVDTCAEYKQRYGPLHYNFSGTIEAGIPLDQQGTPDQDAAVAGVTWNKNGFTTVEIFVDHDQDIIKIWASHYGDPPKLIVDSTLLPNGAELGGSGYTGFQLTPYRTNGAANEANRQDTYVSYAEVIVSENPVVFPGGYELPTGPQPAQQRPTGHPLTTLEPGQWFEVPNSHLQSVDPCPEVSCPPGNTGLKSVVIAWSGATFNTKTDRLLVWGGGHADYSGNEIYAFDIESLKWIRVTDPSTDVSGGSRWLYSDGKPRSMHTWGYIEYVPPLDSFVSFGGVAPYPSSGTTRQVFAYDFVEGRWETNSITDVPIGGEARGANAVYDPFTQDVWVQTANSADSRLHRFDPDSNTWTSHSSKYVKYGSVAAIDPRRSLFVTVGAGQVIAWDLDNPDEPAFSPQTSGDKTLESSTAPGFVYDSSIQKFVGWDGGTDVFVLDPSTWTWTRIPAAAENEVIPTDADQRGTFGRFQYMPDWNAYVVVNNVDQNVYFYRLSDNAAVKPNPPINWRAE